MEKKIDIPTIQITRNERNGRFEIDLNKLLEDDHLAFETLTQQPEQLLKKIEEANKDILGSNHIFLINPPNFLHHKMSNLRAKELGKLIKVNGLLKKVVTPSPRTEWVTFECANCGLVATVQQEENKIKEPGSCDCKFKRPSYVIVKEGIMDIQEMDLEENTEDIGSRQPRSMKILLSDELTDPAFSKFQAGNKVEILGILKKMPLYISKKNSDEVVFEQIIKVLDIVPKESFEEDIHITEEELQQIKDIANNNPLQVMSENIAPNISGNEHIKKAVVLYLAKGVTKQFTNSEKRRGWINMLWVGDAGLSKSVLLQNIKERVANCRLADGKNASKAGLVASMTQDGTSKKWTLEAGDMVLANQGYLLVDEADKLPHSDRQAMHRPMEQGEVEISKVGTHARLKAETAVFAVANPKMGMFDSAQTVISQLDFSPTLLSRFDLIFISKDKPNKEEDGIKANKILGVHMGESKGSLNNELIKKYFMYVSKLKPKLTKECADKISETYVYIRSLSEKNGEKVGMPITPRHLEALVRLAEAHAKLRLSEVVELKDVSVAEEMFKRSLADFGVDLDLGVIDISGLSTKVKLSKKDKYFKLVSYLKTLAQKNNNILDKKETYNLIQRESGMSWGEVDEFIELVKSQGDLFEPAINKLSLTNIN